MPTDQPHTTGKRKAPDGSDNPLLNAAAAKKAKKDSSKSGNAKKRKLPNGTEQTGGLVIVQAPNTSFRPSPNTSSANDSTDRSERQPSRPPSSQSRRGETPVAGPSQPPSKKFRAGSQPPSTSKSFTAPGQDDPSLDQDVRAMDDEAEHLRRNSRMATSIDTPSHDSTSRASPGPSKSRTKFVDRSGSLPERETPTIQRNKRLREPSLSAIRQGSTSSDPGVQKNGHRRRSSLNGRGKRVSDLWESSGVISQPHNSVSESSFYKHIDPELPLDERIRQLLIWCSSRAASTSTSKRSLPKLSDKDAGILKSLQEDATRMLAEKKIDVGSGGSSKDSKAASQSQNQQNVSNRKWQVTYTEHIRRAESENEEWKKSVASYEQLFKSEHANLEKRLAELQQLSAQSDKAKGKQKASDTPDDVRWLPRDHELDDAFRSGSALAKSVLGHRGARLGDERIAGSLTHGGRGSEDAVERRMGGLEFKLDQLFAHVGTARSIASVAEMELNQRFGALAAALDARSNPHLHRHRNAPIGRAGGPSDESLSGAQVLDTYAPRPGLGQPDPQELLRTLAKVDRERPPAKIGDAARRAVREVQRVQDSGQTPIGERRLTFAPPLPATPRTPRRGSTPKKERPPSQPR